VIASSPATRPEFLQQRRRKAFAFVLNKWDRCARSAATGLRPDDDLLRDLNAQGFQDPLLFRTCAQLWLDQASSSNGTEANGPAASKQKRYRRRLSPASPIPPAPLCVARRTER